MGLKQRILFVLLIAFLIFSLPVYGGPLPGITKDTLTNGAVLLTGWNSETDLASVSIMFKVGLLEESKATWGLRDMVLNMMLRKLRQPGGDGKTPEDKGIVISGDTYPDYMEIKITCRGEHLDGMLKSIQTVLLPGWVSTDDFNAVKNEMLAERKGSQGAYQDIIILFRSYFYRYYPYREPQSGYYNAISSVSIDGIRDFLKKYYVPERTVAAIIFPQNMTGVTDAAEKCLGAAKPGESQPIDIPWEPVEQEKEVRLSAYSDLGYVLVGYPAPEVSSSDRPVMDVIQTYLGEGFSSRLFVELREKRGLVYTPGSIYPSLTGPSYILIFAPTAPGNVRKVRNIMVDIIKDIKENGIPPESLSLCRSILKGKLLLSLDNVVERASVYGEAEINGTGYESVRNLPDKYDDITPEDVRRVAGKYFTEYTIIQVNPGGFYIY
ncbi:MAG: insulinase family protein [Chloroflexi bacterium]|nr:insulinase family protein [Chloroflexota bacterium]